MTDKEKSLQSLFDAAIEIELALSLACDGSGDEVEIKTSREKAAALLAAIEEARQAGMRWGE